MTSQPEAGRVPAVTLWTGVLPVVEAHFLVSSYGPLNVLDSRGSIGHNGEGRIWVDEAARAWLMLRHPRTDGACRWAEDGAVEIQCGGLWYRLEDAGRRPAP